MQYIVPRNDKNNQLKRNMFAHQSNERPWLKQNQTKATNNNN